MSLDDELRLRLAEQGRYDVRESSRTDSDGPHPAEIRSVGGWMPSLPMAPPQLDVAGLGPRLARAAAVEHGIGGHQRSPRVQRTRRSPSVHLSSWDDAGVWSRRSQGL